MRHLEDDLQELCVTLFRYRYRDKMIFAIPNGGRRNIREAARLKRCGVLAGVPDLFIAEANKNWNGLFVELKAGKNGTTLSQENIFPRLIEKKYRVEICRTADEFERVTMAYFGDRL